MARNKVKPLDSVMCSLHFQRLAGQRTLELSMVEYSFNENGSLPLNQNEETISLFELLLVPTT